MALLFRTLWRRALESPRGVPALALLPLAAAIRAWCAAFDQGIFWPDEIFQSIEQGHRFAFGVGLVPWEFRDGARSWVFPGLIGIVLKLGGLIGMRSGPPLVILAKGTMALLSVCGVYWAMRVAKALGGSRAALMAGASMATFPALVVFGSRCMSETASAALIMGIIVLLLRPGARAAWAAGLLTALAVFIRYQNGIFAIGFFLYLLFTRRRRDALHLAMAGTLGAMLGGALDWATWGSPFFSLKYYVQFNLIEGRASEWGTEPASYYARTAWTSTGWPIVILALGIVLSLVRTRGFFLMALAFVAAHSAIPHKEFRFILPVVPLLLVLASVGLAWLVETARVPKAAWVLASVLLVCLARPLPNMTHAMMGKDTLHPNGERSVWHLGEGINLALWSASRKPDLCGVVLVGVPLVYTGGFSYLHKDVPLFTAGTPPEQSSANYWIGPLGYPAPPAYRFVRTFDDFTLFRRDGACTPAPAYYSRNL